MKKLLSLEDLYNFYVSQNKNVKFKSEIIPFHGLDFSAEFFIPALSTTFFKCTKKISYKKPQRAVKKYKAK